MSIWARFGGQEGAQLGYSVASAGDVNGDGYEDVIVGAPNPGGSGMAMVFYGRGPWIFYDSFESGWLDAWSRAVP
jgi:hypothetical protein